VYRRIENVRAALDGERPLTPDQRRAVLKARAAALAREPVRADQAGEHLDVVEFLVSHEHYAIETAHLREVHALKDFTPVPGTPPFLLGIVNVRGRILSIIDLKTLFDLPHRGLTGQNKLLIAGGDSMELGLLIDAVCGVRRVAWRLMQASLPTLTGIRQEFLKGVTSDRLVVLDGAGILTHPSLTARDAE
jgi:purine-binding chemotaxis protein CheW